jgi:hypothetical protein
MAWMQMHRTGRPWPADVARRDPGRRLLQHCPDSSPKPLCEGSMPTREIPILSPRPLQQWLSPAVREMPCALETEVAR